MFGSTPLFNACSNGNKELVEYLVEQGADINKENDEDKTVLVEAFNSGNKNLVKYLVKQYLIRYSINIIIYKEKDIINDIYIIFYNQYSIKINKLLKLSYIKEVLNSYREE